MSAVRAAPRPDYPPPGKHTHIHAPLLTMKQSLHNKCLGPRGGHPGEVSHLGGAARAGCPRKARGTKSNWFLLIHMRENDKQTEEWRKEHGEEVIKILSAHYFNSHAQRQLLFYSLAQMQGQLQRSAYAYRDKRALVQVLGDAADSEKAWYKIFPCPQPHIQILDNGTAGPQNLCPLF